MNIVIVGLGNVGKHYLSLCKKMKNVNKIYVMENNKKINKSLKYNFVNKTDFEKKKYM